MESTTSVEEILKMWFQIQVKCELSLENTYTECPTFAQTVPTIKVDPH